MDVLTLNVGEMDFYMNPNTVYFMVPMLDNLSYAMTTSNTYFKKAPELTHDIDQEWFHDNCSNVSNWPDRFRLRKPESKNRFR